MRLPAFRTPAIQRTAIEDCKRRTVRHGDGLHGFFQGRQAQADHRCRRHGRDFVAPVDPGRHCLGFAADSVWPAAGIADHIGSRPFVRGSRQHAGLAGFRPGGRCDPRASLPLPLPVRPEASRGMLAGGVSRLRSTRTERGRQAPSQLMQSGHGLRHLPSFTHY